MLKKIDHRKKFTISMFAYLFLNSVLFGAIFSRPLSATHIMIGLMCGMVAQLIVLYILVMLKNTSER